MCSPAPSAPFQHAGRRVQLGGGGPSSREAQKEMAAMLESGSMDNLLLRMVAPMLHRVVAILFMAGLIHGRKVKELELKVGLGKKQPGLLPLAAGLHAFPPRPAVLPCPPAYCRMSSCVLHLLQPADLLHLSALCCTAATQSQAAAAAHAWPAWAAPPEVAAPSRRKGCLWSRSLASDSALDSTTSPPVPNEWRCSCGACSSDIDKPAHGLELCTID